MLGQENSSVEVLINPITISWRSDIIDHVFGAAEADVIKSISEFIEPTYLVKSGCRFLQESSNSAQRSTPDPAFWKKLWSLEVPNKV